MTALDRAVRKHTDRKENKDDDALEHPWGADDYDEYDYDPDDFGDTGGGCDDAAAADDDDASDDDDDDNDLGRQGDSVDATDFDKFGVDELDAVGRRAFLRLMTARRCALRSLLVRRRRQSPPQGSRRRRTLAKS